MEPITVSETIYAPLSAVWACYTEPKHITGWNFASDDWHCPKAENDFQVGGKLCWTMAAKDGSFSFDFRGTFSSITPMSAIEYTIADGRKVWFRFEEMGDSVLVTETFEPEGQNPAEMQKAGWQAILTNFKRYVEKEN